jgi:hypothetical protein
MANSFEGHSKITIIAGTFRSPSILSTREVRSARQVPPAGSFHHGCHFSDIIRHPTLIRNLELSNKVVFHARSPCKTKTEQAARVVAGFETGAFRSLLCALCVLSGLCVEFRILFSCPCAPARTSAISPLPSSLSTGIFPGVFPRPRAAPARCASTFPADAFP